MRPSMHWPVSGKQRWAARAGPGAGSTTSTRISRSGRRRRGRGRIGTSGWARCYAAALTLGYGGRQYSTDRRQLRYNGQRTSSMEGTMSSYLASDTRYDTMRYNRTGRSGLKLPAISLGLWHNFGGVDTLENGRAMVLRAFDLGIAHFDLANNYGPPPGSAEETFGQIMRRDLAPYRDEMIVSTKAGYWMWPGPYGEWGSRKYLVASLDQSLRRMGLDYVD